MPSFFTERPERLKSHQQKNAIVSAQNPSNIHNHKNGIPLFLKSGASSTLSSNIIQRQVEEDEEELIQTKLIVGQPDDIYEQEADRVADQVMRMPEPDVQRSS